jgi:hypothetical protein
MSAIREAQQALTTRILDGAGEAPIAQRRAAFDNAGSAEGLAAVVKKLVNKVANEAYKVTDEDIAGVRASGMTEDQVFEIVVCAAVGQATRQYDAALAALEAATSRE